MIKKTTHQIRQLRTQIDQLDLEIMKLLKRRLTVSKRIGTIKKRAGIAVKQEQREEKALNLRLNRGKKLKMEEVFIKKLFQLIFRQSRLEQQLFDKKVKN